MFAIVFQFVTAANFPTFVELHNCYSGHSSIELVKATRKLILNLETTHNSACAVIDSGIGVNLTLGSTAIPYMLMNYYADFSYENTTQIQIDIPGFITNSQLEDYTSEQFALVEIYSWSHKISLNIMVFDEVRSNLQNCFDSLATEIVEDEIRLLLDNTDICSTQFVTRQQNTESYVEAVTLMVDTFKFDIDVQTFLNGYQSKNMHEIILHPSKDYLNAIKEVVNVKAALQIEVNQGGDLVTLNYQTETMVKSLDNFFGRKLAVRQNNSIISLFTYNMTQVEQMLNKISAYDQVIHRLTAVYEETVITFQKTYQAPFDIAIQEMKLDCTTGTDVDQVQCNQLLNLSLQYGTKVQLFFDIMLYNGNDLQSVQKTKLQIMPQGFWKGYGHIQENGVCIETEPPRRDGKQFLSFLARNEGKTVEQQLFIKEILAQDETNVLAFQNKGVYSRYNTQYCFSCSELVMGKNCKEFLARKLVQETHEMFLTVNDGHNLSSSVMMLIVYRFSNGNYKAQKIAAIVIGVIIATFSAIVSLIGMLNVQRSIKQLRRKRE